MSEEMQSPVGPWLGDGEGENVAINKGLERVKALHQTIENIQKVKKYLQLNSVEVKSSIHTTMSRLLEALRNREVWLMDQVDVVYQAKEAVLRRQEDRLNRVLGGLSNLLNLVDDAGTTSEELLSYLNSINGIDLHAEESPHITFRADMLALRDIIQKFGRVDSKGLLLPGAPLAQPQGAGFGSPEGSKVAASLPRQLEEYEDEEHQILYKTLNSVEQQDCGETKIVVNIPKLSESSRGVSFLTQGPTSAPISSRSETSAVEDPKVVPSTMGNSRMWNFGLGNLGLKNSVKQPVMKESASASVLDNLLGKEKGLSRTSSLRQWLADITTDGCGLDDDEGLIGLSDSRLADLGYGVTEGISEASSDSAFINSSPIEVKIFSVQDDRQLEAGVMAHDGQKGGATHGQGEGCKDEVFESFRRICQRPLSDWLSRMYAVIDSKRNQSQAVSGLRYTLAAFHKIINSPVSDWLQVTHSTGDFNQSGAFVSPGHLRGRVDKLINSHAGERMRNKWLIQDGRCCEDSPTINENFMLVKEKNSGKVWLVSGDESMNTEKYGVVVQRNSTSGFVFIENGGKSDCGNGNGDGGIGNSITGVNVEPFGDPFRRDIMYFANQSGASLDDGINESNVYSSPIGCYVKKLHDQPTKQWLDNQVGVACNEQYSDAFNPTTAYLDRSTSKPASYWLNLGEKAVPKVDGQIGAIEGISKKYKSEPLSRYLSPSCTDRPVQQNNVTTPCDIGRVVSCVPIGQWMQYDINSDQSRINIGAAIASKPLSDWLYSSTNRKSDIRKEDSYERFLAHAMPVKTAPSKVALIRGGSLKSMFTKNEDAEKSPMRLVECMHSRSLRDLSGSGLEDFECVSDEGSSDESFVAIGQHDMSESVSASMALPAAFCQPIERWMQQGEKSCRPITCDVADVGRGVVDRFDLMQVSDWVVQ